jgi:hypothetical protein
MKRRLDKIKKQRFFDHKQKAKAKKTPLFLAVFSF